MTIAFSKTCGLCHGEGKLYESTGMRESDTGAEIDTVRTCPDCGGLGLVEDEPEDDHESKLEDGWLDQEERDAPGWEGGFASNH